jgi:hypothetical protein
MNKLRDQSGGWAIVETAVAVVQKRSIQTIPAASTAGPGSAEPFSGAFATMMTASSGKIHPAFTSQSTSGPSAPLILSQPILVRSVCKGAAGAFGAPGISPMICIRRRNRLRISAGGEAGQLPSHPLRRIGRRVAIQWVQRNIQVWAWTSLEGTVVLAIKAAADLDQHKLANGLTLQQNQRKAEHLLDRNSITFDRRKVGAAIAAF